MFREKDCVVGMSDDSSDGGLLRIISKWDAHNSFTAAGLVTRTTDGFRTAPLMVHFIPTMSLLI